ncbi:hypothetical protein [Kitasatospora sp. NPDC059571]|uniref:hypothetical protein n=1 Tax=Kitasatospora sp. NPDC059571 TaxID=3346871 RepID=UPI0036739B41
MIVRKLHDAGLTSEHAYAAAFGSIGLSLVSWMTSLKAEQAGVERADRWGIFIGEWAPTFFALGLALARYEENPRGASSPSDGTRRPEGSPEPFGTSS